MYDRKEQGMLTNREKEINRWIAYLSCRSFTLWLRPGSVLLPLLLALNHSVLEGLSVAPGARPFHYNGYKTPANISKHAGLLTSTTWPLAKAALVAQLAYHCRHSCSAVTRPTEWLLILDSLRPHQPRCTATIQTARLWQLHDECWQMTYFFAKNKPETLSVLNILWRYNLDLMINLIFIVEHS